MLNEILIRWYQTMTNSYNLDWYPVFDEQSKQYSVSSLPFEIKDVTKIWKQGIILNQGKEGACVGYASTGALLSEPDLPRFTMIVEANAFASNLYKSAQKIDEYLFNKRGTSVLAAAKVLKNNNIIMEYRWCFSINDVINAIINFGPVVAGIRWYDSFDKPNPFGLIEITQKSAKRRHAIVIDAYIKQKDFGNEKYDVFRIRNSWGKFYGHNGSAYIKVTDMERLIKELGEFCLFINKSLDVRDGKIISTIKD